MHEHRRGSTLAERKRRCPVGVYAELEREAPAWWHEHCLAESEGYRVKIGEHVVGFVEDVLFENGRPSAIVIEMGRAQPWHAVVPLDEIVSVDPEFDLIEVKGGEDLGQLIC
jgi:uncharacterized protein YrrD